MAQATPQPKGMLGAGPLIWAHATNTRRMAALVDLMRQQQNARPDCRVLLTYDPKHVPAPPEAISNLPMVPLKDSTQAAARIFLNHWKPDIGIWTGGDVSAALVTAAVDIGTDMMLVDADDDILATPRLSLFRNRRSRVADRFSHILTASPKVTTTLPQRGLPPERIEHTGTFVESSNPPHWPAADVENTRQELAGRPIWLAAHVRARELPVVIKAHQSAVRLSHRLLLVLSPAKDCNDVALAQALKDSGLRWAHHDGLDTIEESVQLVSCHGSDLGLWMRLAGLCFLGDSLLRDSSGHHPFDAAALGAGVLYGPKVGTHLGAYSRLASAGAARMVQDGDTLGTAITRMMAPDQVANMALSGWNVVTEGAMLSDRILELIQETLDHRKAHHAGA